MAWAAGWGSGERRSDGSVSFVVNRTPSLSRSQVTRWKANSYEICRHEGLLAGFTYRELWRGDESPLQIVAQRCAFAADLRGEAPERRPKPEPFMIHSSLAIGVGITSLQPPPETALRQKPSAFNTHP